MTADEPSRSLRVARLSRPSGAAEAAKGEMAMICPETQTGQLLRKTARLLNSVAEAAWTNGTSSPARWELHRIGTGAYLAHREILDALGQGAVPAEHLPATDIAATLAEAANTLAAISQQAHNLDTERLATRVSSLAGATLALAPPVQFGQDRDPRSVVWTESRDVPAVVGGTSPPTTTDATTT